MSRVTREILLDIIRKNHPPSLGALKECLRESKIEFTDEELMGLVNELEAQRVLVLGNPEPDSFVAYLAEYNRAFWFYAMIILPLVESFLVIYGSQEQVFAFFRLVLGLGLLGFMPGYSAIRALFPQFAFSSLEKLVLSIFLSVIISISLGTILGAVFLFDAGTNVLLLSSFSIFLALVAGYRTFKTLKQRDLRGNPRAQT